MKIMNLDDRKKNKCFICGKTPKYIDGGKTYCNICMLVLFSRSKDNMIEHIQYQHDCEEMALEGRL